MIALEYDNNAMEDTTTRLWVYSTLYRKLKLKLRMSDVSPVYEVST